MCQSQACSHVHLVKQSRHPLQRVFFSISVLITLIVFVAALALSIFKTETLEAAHESAVEQYRLENPQLKLDEQMILDQLS